MSWWRRLRRWLAYALFWDTISDEFDTAYDLGYRDGLWHAYEGVREYTIQAIKGVGREAGE